MVETLKIAMLGLSGSGKTTYLASMFRKLSVPSKDIGFYYRNTFSSQVKTSRGLTLFLKGYN
jgi:adenylate kinase family enzyme